MEIKLDKVYPDGKVHFTATFTDLDEAKRFQAAMSLRPVAVPACCEEGEDRVILINQVLGTEFELPMMDAVRYITDISHRQSISIEEVEA